VEEEILPSALKRSGLKRRRVTEADIRHALANQVVLPFLWDSPEYDDTRIHVGPAWSGQLIEVGMAPGPTGTWRIVHAMLLRRKFANRIPDGGHS
jgi:hypothetical protein